MNIEKIKEHYDHAREKHSYFCDFITRLSQGEANELLNIYRDAISVEKKRGCLTASRLLGCELYEAMQAYTQGDNASAVEECYDAIAVLLRTIDVLEGRQELGNPDEKES